MVAVGATPVDPDGATAPTPWSIATLAAPEVVHDNVAAPPAAMVDGDAARVATGGDTPEAAVHASTSVSRVIPPATLVTTIRMAEVVIGAKLTCFQTSVLPTTCPPGTTTQAAPFQYWMSKFSAARPLVSVGVGSTGADQATCIEKTLTWSMVDGAAKVTWYQSGAPPLASSQVPSCPRMAPERRPSMAAGG